MKRIILVLALLLIAAPAWAAIELNFEQTDAWIEGEEGFAEGILSYDVNGENIPRAWALEVTLDTEDPNYVIDWIWRIGASDMESGYWVTPSNIVIGDGEVGDWGAPNTELEGGYGIIEVASLYADGDPPPPDANALVGITIIGPADGSTVCFDLAVEPVRGGVIDEALASLTIDPNGPMCVELPTACEYPACWDFDTQCHGDATGDGAVDTSDWPYFRDSFFESYPSVDYLPCGDYNRDGVVNTTDWPEFRDNFFEVIPTDCAPGDPCEIYCPAE